MATTERLELIKPEPGDTVSAGTAGVTLDVLDEAVAARHADFEEHGVLSGISLTAGTGLSISIGTGVIWHRYRRDTPEPAVIDEDDGLTEDAGTVFIFYDDTNTPAYYAGTSATPASPDDILVGTAVIAGTSVTEVAEAPKLATNRRQPRLTFGDASEQSGHDYPRIAAGTAVLAAGSATVTLSEPFADADSYVVVATPTGAGPPAQALSAVRTSRDSFTIYSSLSTDSRAVAWQAIGY